MVMASIHSARRDRSYGCVGESDLADLEIDAEPGSFGRLIAAAPQVRPAGLREIRLGVLQLLQLIDEPLDP